MGDETTATAQLIDLIHDISFDDLPTRVVHDTKRLIADTVGCALGARHYAAARIVAEVAAEMGGPGAGAPATVVGTTVKASPAATTAANMYLGNYLDADDTYLSFSHPGVAAVFPGLAFAESVGLSGEALITAVALGYEVGCRVGGALEFIRLTPAGDIEAVPGCLGWYGFSVAGAVGKLLDFTPAQYNNAFGLAGWTAPIETGQFFAPVLRPGKHMLKYSPVSSMGINGVMAAQLAHKGFVGEQNIFDAPEEFWRAFGTVGLNRQRLLAELGETWQVSRTSFKPYSACRYGHPAIALFTKLIRRHELEPQDIDRVVVRTFERGVNWLGPTYAPETPSDLQFSIPMALGAAAHGSDLGPSWQDDESIHDPRYLAFARKVVVEGHPDSGKVIFEQMLATGRFTRIPNEVQINARGKEFSESCEYVWGDPGSDDTRMTDDQVKDKYRTYAQAALSAAQVDQSLQVMFTLDKVNNVAKELTPLLQQE
ncbi:2-methylcitrate dehydratase PrpD [Mycobacterium rhizamassiliense]|uniref:2-methylcitrate dehydratase PrpD n=2 Tax=Mycobacterium TaxID=1763 RepID=A0A2U3PA96_9MYCO|nr:MULTISPECIES: MmgE/PrpD family protein [Mycobacterium]SPM34859.1 2-methylcitrate dehydratase PrpD [Mycobacterium rhizamassiliense]SPM40688.1 2-methylcitrate dehydratase PrpD [Mycobacterium numidiamassiliense]